MLYLVLRLCYNDKSNVGNSVPNVGIGLALIFSPTFNCLKLLNEPPINKMKPLAGVGFTGIKDVTYW